MITATTKTKNNIGQVKKAVNNATYQSIFQCVASIRLIAKRSIRYTKNRKKHGDAGKPPKTHTKRLQQAILFYADKNRMYGIVGPSADIVGTAGMAHEFGGKYKRQRFPKRPFMFPAAEIAAPRMPANWASNFK